MTAGAPSALVIHAVIDIILGRRSVRENLLRDPVPRGVIEDVVRCGLAAPSAKGARPSRFHVVTSTDLLANFAEAMRNSDDVDDYLPFDPATGRPRPQLASSVLASASILAAAPLAIFVENTGVLSRGRGALLEASPRAQADCIVGYTFEIIGVGAAVENMWLAAEAHGLSGVFLGDALIAEDEITRGLSISGDLIGALVLGYTRPEKNVERVDDSSGTDHVVWH
jgi:nitroreductase